MFLFRKNILLVFILTGLTWMVFPCAAFALGTASGTIVTNTVTMDVYNATATAPTSSSSATVRAVYGFATAAYAEEPGKNAAAGATATYDFTLVNNGNAADAIAVDLGAQNFSGTTGATAEWAVAAERVGVGFINFQNSGAATASQAGDTATATAVPSGATITLRLHNRTSPSAADGASTNYSVAFRTSNFPGAAYTGYNGIVYAGPPSWSRQVSGGLVITTINGIVLDATKTFVIAAPATYVTNGGGAADPIPGATITFTVTFANAGSVAAASVIISDDLPASTTYRAGSTKSCFSGAGCTPATDADADGPNPDCYFIPGAPQEIRCDIDSLAGAGGGVVTYSVIID